jgi:hypothetical protein
MLLDELLRRTHEGARSERELIASALGFVDAVQQRASEIR